MQHKLLACADSVIKYNITCLHAAGKAQLLDFDPFSPQPKMSYKDGYQKQYFVLNSFEDGAKQLLDYCLSITDPAVVKQHLKNLDVPL